MEENMKNNIYILLYVYSLSYSAAAAKSLQSCPTLCDPIDSSLPGSPVPGILQARTLEWVHPTPTIVYRKIYDMITW